MGHGSSPTTTMPVLSLSSSLVKVFHGPSMKRTKRPAIFDAVSYKQME
jgi:hypothetical protein